MTRLTDALIDRLAHAEAPHAYTFEVKAMATEIMERRASERAVCAQSQQHGNAGCVPGQPFPRSTYP